MDKTRCAWSLSSPRMIEYHDHEWGVPVHDDQLLFEYIVLDAFQAGLSWQAVLHKREHFRFAFDNFDANKIAYYDEAKQAELVADAGIIRNRAKIAATIGNAKAYLAIQKEFGSFDAYIWQFTQGKTIQNNWQELKQIPPLSPEAEAMSKDLKKRGFKFVGPTICYAFMQAAGMVNDHVTTCFRHKEVME
jgi:DNA-3-methyladenine glycosylase I